MKISGVRNREWGAGEKTEVIYRELEEGTEYGAWHFFPIPDFPLPTPDISLGGTL